MPIGERNSLSDLQPEWLVQVRDVLETLNQGVIITDECPRIVYANAVFQDMVGRTADELEGQYVKDLFPPEDVPGGELLSGWPLPDLGDTPGTFTYFASDIAQKDDGSTVEGGIRWPFWQPWYSTTNNIANFDPRFYDRSKAAVINPTTGRLTGGDRYNGIVLPGSTLVAVASA